MNQKEYDYLVIGGGTGGAIVAARLARESDFSVALIEAGPADEGDERVLELRPWMELLGTELDYDYTIEPQLRGNSSIRHSRGKVLGGCSSHNSAIAFQAPAGDFERWVDAGASGWSAAEIEPFYRRVWEKVDISSIPPENPLNLALIDGAVEAGLPRARFARSTRAPAGVSLFEISANGGRRSSASVAYLHPLSALPHNLTLITETRALRLLWNGDEVNGVRTDRGELRARREVILCCGAFDTPRLLLLSGIGPADDLKQMGIPVRRDLPAVGRHLQDHPEGVVVHRTRRPVPEPIVQYWEVGLFTRTGIDPSPDPDLMLHFGLMPFTWNTAPLGFPTAPHGVSLTPNVCRARSEGSVRLAGPNPEDGLRIDFAYFTDPEGYDEKIMVEGVRLARHIFSQPAMQPWLAEELAPGPGVTSDEEISAYVRRTANTVYHPCGSCRMGSDERDTVVSPELVVHGMPGLRIADASIFPTITTVNPAMTVMMVGERCADLILGE